MSDINTAIANFTKLYTANVSAASITAPTPTTTAPSGDGYFSMVQRSAPGFNAVQFVFYGTRSSADNETFTAKVVGWRLVGTLWVPLTLLSTLTLTQGTSVGVASADVVATEYFADTLVVTTGGTAAYEAISPADNTIASISVDAKGCCYVQALLAKGTNATCNVLAAGF